MAANYTDLAKKIIEQVGGKENIAHITNCATRLRFNLKDDSIVDIEKVKKIPGVLGSVNSGGQFQVIIGPDVPQVCQIIKEQIDFKETGAAQASGDGEKKSVLEKVMDTIAGIFTPILPAITGAGMLKALIVVLTAFHVLSADSQTYQILAIIADSAFYFLPILLAHTSATKFKCNPYVAMAIAGALVYPDFITLLNAGEPVRFLGLPVTVISYASSVLPILLSIWFMSFVQKFFEKIMPKFIKFFAVPLCTMLVVAPVTVVVLGPLGGIVGNGLAAFIAWLDGIASFIVPTIIGATFPLLVMTGMHYSLLPISLNQLAISGTETIFAAGALAPNIGQGAAALCVALKSKNKDLKEMALSTGITAIFGITEPAMYGINMRLKKPLVAVLIGGACGGFYAGVSGLYCPALITPGLTSMLAYFGDGSVRNMINAVITAAIGFVVTFVATWFLGFEDDVPEEEISESAEAAKEERTSADTATEKKIELSNDYSIVAPISGEAKALSECPDPVFSSGMLGDGVIIEPAEGKVYAPCNGSVASIFDTKHAIGLSADNGAEILIHVGLDTVSLGGEGFTPHVKAGDKISKGQLLLEFDMDFIKSKNLPVVTPVLISNLDTFSNNKKEFGTVKHGDEIIKLEK